MSNRKGFDNPSLQYLDRKGEVVWQQIHL
jgi:hypothetical protein